MWHLASVAEPIFRCRLCRLIVAASLLASCCSAYAQSAPKSRVNRIIDHPRLSVTTRLSGHLPRWIDPALDVGAVPDETPLALTVLVSRAPESEAAFGHLLADQQDQASSQFHHWLTPLQIGQRYGPTQHDLDALTAWLLSQGFTVDNVSPSRTFVHISGTAGISAAAFHTSFRSFLKDGRIYRSAIVEPAIPTAFHSVLGAISGLSEMELRPMSHAVSLSSFSARGKSSVAADLSAKFTSASGNHFLFPADFSTIFNLGSVYQTGIRGTGQKVAIIGRSRVVLSDVSAFERVAALPNNVPNIIVVPFGTDPGIVPGDEGESILDLTRVIGTAPEVQADLVISGSTTSDGIYLAAQYEVQTLLDPILTLSYGSCEANASLTEVNLWSSLFQQAAAEGISVFVASADSAADTCERQFAPAERSQVRSINYICANPYATCVGGTEFVDRVSPASFWAPRNSPGSGSALGYIPEGAWNDPVDTDTSPSSYEVRGSGGGASIFVAKPLFQAGVGVASDQARDVPDVSFPASSHDGYFSCQADFDATGGGDCDRGGGLIFAGTSAGAPSWAGVAALLDQKLGIAQGSLNNLIYRLAANPANQVFHDVTPASTGVSSCDLSIPSLCNNSTPSPTSLSGGLAGYAVTTGFDLVTGWGSVDVGNLLAAASGEAALNRATGTLRAVPSSIDTLQTTQFTASLVAPTGTPTGFIQFNSNGSALGAPVALASGVAVTPSLAFATPDTYLITARYSGDANFSPVSFPALAFVVVSSGTVPSAAALSSSNTIPNGVETVGFSVIVRAAVAASGSAGRIPTGRAQFSIDGSARGLAIALSSGSATLPALLLAVGTHSISCAYSGDSVFAASSSVLSVTVSSSAFPSNTSITLSSNAVSPSGTIILTALVNGFASGPNPSGSVTLISGSTSSSPTQLQNGTASLILSGSQSALPPGSYVFSFAYSGDTVYAPSQSSPVSLTVALPTVAVTPVATSLNILAGSSARDTITVSSGTYAGIENLTCMVKFNGVGTPSYSPTCSFVPSSVNMTVNGKAPTTLIISTTAPHGTVGISHASSRRLVLSGIEGTVFCILFLPFMPRSRRRAATRILCSLFCLALLETTGCSKNDFGLTPPVAGSTVGSYDVVISANSSLNQPGNVGSSGTIHLAIQ